MTKYRTQTKCRSHTSFKLFYNNMVNVPYKGFNFDTIGTTYTTVIVNVTVNVTEKLKAHKHIVLYLALPGG